MIKIIHIFMKLQNKQRQPNSFLEKNAEIIRRSDLGRMLSDYQVILAELSKKIKDGADYAIIKEIEKNRKEVKSKIVEKIIDGFRYQQEDNENFTCLKALCQEVLNRPYPAGSDLFETSIDAFEYAKNLINQLAYKRHEIKQTDPEHYKFLLSEYQRLKPYLNQYLEPQNIVTYKNKREPSIWEAIIATARLTKLKEQIVENIGDKTDAVIIAGSLNWGTFYDTRGTGMARSLIDGIFKEGNFREQFSLLTSEQGGLKVKKEIKEDEPSDVDVVIVAEPDENIRKIYKAIFKDKKDPKAEINTKIIEKFEAMLKDDSMPNEKKPVSINLDFVGESGYVGQMIIFSNRGFKTLYRFDVNDLEKIYSFSQEEIKKKGPLYYEEQEVEIVDADTGKLEKSTANVFFHPNLDYIQGTPEEIEKKVKKPKEFQQALIGGKRLIGKYPVRKVGEPVLLDPDKKVYGQYLMKYYPFGGFMEESGGTLGSYFLGINTDNMIIGNNSGRQDTEASRLGKDFKFKYFERIRQEQLKNNNLTTGELLTSKAKDVFGPFLSRWSRMPKHSRKNLFNEFREYLKAKDLQPNNEFYFAALADTATKEKLHVLQQLLKAQPSLKNIELINPKNLHLTEFYFPSWEKLNAKLRELQPGLVLNFAEFQESLKDILPRSEENDFTIQGIKLLDTNALALILAKKTARQTMNEQIFKLFTNYLTKQKVSRESIKALFSDNEFTLRYHQADNFLPHITLAKTKSNEPLELSGLETAMIPLRGDIVRFDKCELKSKKFKQYEI